MIKNKLYTSAIVLGLALTGNTAFAACAAPLPDHATLQAALKSATLGPSGVLSAAYNGGFGLNMWATVVNRAGIVCDVVFTGAGPGDQWPGSRVISAQKANTANAFSLPGLPLSTANLYTATQPGGTLFGLQESNPVNVAAAYAGSFAKYGSASDPLIGYRIGGINVFGGGLALYTAAGKLVGGIGVSGDSSCADHNVAWRTRKILTLDHIPGGVGPNGTDGIDYTVGSGWAHPVCSAEAKSVAVLIGAGK